VAWLILLTLKLTTHNAQVILAQQKSRITLRENTGVTRLSRFKKAPMAHDRLSEVSAQGCIE
jgi:hypothetical protein